MVPKQQYEEPKLFQSRLDQILNLKHPLCILANEIDWKLFADVFGSYYSEKRGSPGKPIRLMVGLHYLKHAFNESDESVVERFIENPYWSRPGGMVTNTFGVSHPFSGKHDFPIDPSSMSRWHQRVGKAGMKKLFRELLQTAKRTKQLKRSDLNHVNVDTTI